MIPRVAQSGSSFRGAGLYYLNDKLSSKANDAFQGIGDYALHDKSNRQTAERVGFTAILNMEARTPEEAIDQMSSSFERYQEREARKRGRKLAKPVYTYSLAWAPDQSPDKPEMMEAALSSLKALRLEGLQTLIVQHTDEPHPHIHIIINRIERDGSRARNIPFDQLRFSRWAEEYERTHGGIRCEQRVENNRRRALGDFVKDEVSLKPAEYKAREEAAALYVAAWRSEQHRKLDGVYNPQVITLLERHARERDDLITATRQRISSEAKIIDRKMSPQWTALYQTQAERFNEFWWANRRGIFERACFVYRHKGLLKKTGRLRMRDIVRLCLSGKALAARLTRAHKVEKAELSNWRTTLGKKAAAIAWGQHREEWVKISQRHTLERDSLRYWRGIDRAQIEQTAETMSAVKQPEVQRTAPALSDGAQMAPGDVKQFFSDAQLSKNFNQEAKPMSGDDYARDLERRLDEYKRRNQDRDFDRGL